MNKKDTETLTVLDQILSSVFGGDYYPDDLEAFVLELEQIGYKLVKDN